MSSTPRSLILGAFANLPVRCLEPFAQSLRATGFRGRLFVVAAGYNARELDDLRALADRVETVDEDYASGLPPGGTVLKYVRRQRGLRRAYPPMFEAIARTAPERESFERWRRLEYHLEGLQSLRYMHYHRCLLENAPDVDVVMISDLRDVVFQCDPFADPVTGLEVYLEDDSVRLGQDDFNTHWLRDLFGRRMVEAMHGRPVSCSGTVVGTRDAMLAYLSEMMMSIAWRRRPMGPHDQGVHNALIRTGRLQSVNIVPNEHGRVLTLGKMKTLRTNSDGFLVNADGSIPAVVHQWDRHSSFVSKLHPFTFVPGAAGAYAEAESFEGADYRATSASG